METASATTMTQQEGLNQVVINKVQRMIDGKAVGVQATMERLVNEGKVTSASLPRGTLGRETSPQQF